MKKRVNVLMASFACLENSIQFEKVKNFWTKPTLLLKIVYDFLTLIFDSMELPLVALKRSKIPKIRICSIGQRFPQIPKPRKSFKNRYPIKSIPHKFLFQAKSYFGKNSTFLERPLNNSIISNTINCFIP